MATLKQIAQDARDIAGEKDHTNPNDVEVLRFAEESLQKIGKLLEGIDPRVFGQIEPLNFLTSANAAVICTSGATYAPTTKTITKTGQFATGTYPNLNDDGVIVGYLSDEGTYTTNFFAYASSMTDNTLVLDRDISYGLGTPTIIEFIYISGVTTSNPTLTLSSVVSRLVMLTSSRQGSMLPLESKEFLSVTDNPNYAASAAFYQRGQSLETALGSSCSPAALGVLFAFYKRRPRTLTAMTDTVDLSLKYHQLLRDDIAAKLIARAGKTAPPELADPLAPLMAQLQVSQKNLDLAQMRKVTRK